MKTIEETYQKMSQESHVLKRPGMYIGSTKKTVEELWVFDNVEKKMIKKMVEYTPGFLKIFDEVLTNALDHSARDPTVDKIKLEYNKETGYITVYNNGTGIPVVEHKEHKVYVPELIFGQMLSGSNYDDTQSRTGAGMNGLGIKVSNIYSTKFVIETIDSERGFKFVQEYSNNMSSKTKPKITKNTQKSYTQVTFLPDYKRFEMKGLEDDTILLLNKRIYDCVACTNSHVNVFLNGEKIKGKGLLDYVKYFFDETTMNVAYEQIEQRVNGVNFLWEYIVVPWEHYEQVSFVNGNSTYQGGKHVDYIMYQVISKLKTLLETKKKLKDIKPAMIKERMFLFLRATVVNPQFSSQTKEQLTTQSKDFGCKVEVSNKFIDKLWKSSIIEDIVNMYKLKESIDLAKKTDGTKKNKVYVPKLEDALWAGTAKSDLCTLILTEGDSAKTFALWGRSVMDKGIERYATFPLKGKVLNIRDATAQQLINNEEINNLKQIIGLKQDVEYTNTSSLRYGKVMLLTDSDVDGSHIKGLLVNFFHAYWPSLMKLDFVQTLRTPIIKAIKGKKVLEFYTEQDYNKWKQSGINPSSFQIRYFKGLGTSTKEDAKETFRKMENLKIDYYHKNIKCDEAILLAFDKDKNSKTKKKDTDNESESDLQSVKCTDKRKMWLSKYDKNAYIDYNQTRVSFQDFIHKELIHFSIYDNLRSIPSMCDGLKPSQRKILYYMLQKNITKSIKVAQLSGYVSAETSYHHGEASLQQAIISMAQDFVGSNNINLLVPDGNHGSRINAGKDAASPRYIFTHLSPITQCIFHHCDTPLLKFMNDDGLPIEPEWYVPVIPMVLVNGCEGIGTGYSTYIPPHNPEDIIANIIRILDYKDPLEMKPYFRGFNGNVVDMGQGNYVTQGKWERISDGQIRVTELPVGVWVTPYKEFLESLIENSPNKKEGPKKRFVLKDVKNKTTDENTAICFIIDFKNSDDLDKLIETGTLMKELKLTKTFNTNNMYLFDDNTIPVKYNTTLDILLDFYDMRLEFYKKRRLYLIDKLEQELVILKSKSQFIEEYIEGTIDINRKSSEYIISLLEEKRYPKHTDGYDYLVKMPLISMTAEKINDLNAQIEKKTSELNALLSSSEKDLWKQDLQSVTKKLKNESN
jgi:DNA topoisomerase II